MIIVKEISKRFYVKKNRILSLKKEKKEVVKKISFKIPKGQITGLIGINGAGKTTTIKMLTTLLDYDEGQIIYDGLDLKSNKNKIRNIINMIAGGDKNLYLRLTAQENLEYFGSLYGIEEQLLSTRIDKLLNLVGLSESKNKPVEQFSKGMKQRSHIAKGLVNDPQYIFLDEPTLGLDIQVAADLRKYIKSLSTQYNKGILLTSHYFKEVEELCDYLYIINKGKIIMEGTVSEIINKIGNKKTFLIVANLSKYQKKELKYSLCSNGNIEFNGNEIKIESEKIDLEDIMKYFIKANIEIISIKQTETDLESALLSLNNKISLEEDR